MPWNPDKEVQQVIEAAKLATPDPGVLNVATLLAAAVHKSRLGEKFGKLQRYLPEPRAVRADASRQVDLNPDVSSLVNELVKRLDSVTLDAFFLALLFSPAGRNALASGGMPETDLKSLLDELRPAVEPRIAELIAVPPKPAGPVMTAEIKAALEAISPYGRLITDRSVLYPARATAGIDETFADFYAALLRARWPSVAIVGPIGSGKKKIVYELCRRIIDGHQSLPARLRDLHVFELNINALRAHDGQRAYESRVEILFRALRSCRNLALFCDDLEALFQGDLAMLNALSRSVTFGDAKIIAVAQPEEYDKLAAEHHDIFSCMACVRLRPMDRASALRVLQAGRSHVEEVFAPLRIPEALLPHVVELAEQYLPPVPVEPKRSIDLLDRACAEASARVPPAAEVTIEHVHEAIFDQTGRRVGLPPSPITLDGRPATEVQIFEYLRGRVIGQDSAVATIAQRLHAAHGPFAQGRRGPLGVFMFAGPTGVGKTETALALAQLRGGPGGKPALIRIDCNTLAGNDYDKTPMIWRLFGVQPGFRGAGEGNLSAIRHNPASVVLFDELEKASFAIYKILLQMIDHGEVRDSQENLLDFSQAIVIFTTNAGVDYSGGHHFGLSRPAGDVNEPRADEASVIASFENQGYGMEFFGRLQLLVFNPLSDDDAEKVLLRELGTLKGQVERMGKSLTWADDVPPTLVKRYKSQLGVRYLLRVVQRQIMDQLNIAHSRGEMSAGVKAVRIDLMPVSSKAKTAARSSSAIGASERKTEGETLKILVS
jgi:ATP-dependent Clp protease ATP-binding subunit ClpA